MDDLRVALDATGVITGRTGIAVYIGELARRLPSTGVAVSPYTVGRASHPPPGETRSVGVPARIVHALWRSGLPPRPERIVPGVDVVHAASLAVPTTRRPLVVTVYDVVAIEHPELHPRRTARQLHHLIGHLHRADAVTVISEATADAVARTGYPRENVVVAYPGLSPVAETSAAPLIDGPYLLAVGEQHPRKALDLLLHAVAELPDTSLRLVHAGPPGEATDELVRLVGELGLTSRVQFLGFVSRSTLSSLMAGATALCFPSWSEGFGLPVLEAMAARTPVVGSDIPPVRELAAGNALLFPPGDLAALVSALVAVSTDDRCRARLVAGGLERASRFTWEACAAATRAAYDRALANA